MQITHSAFRERRDKLCISCTTNEPMASARKLFGVHAWAKCHLFDMQPDIKYTQLLLILQRPTSRDYTLKEIRALSSGGGARLSACIDNILLDSSR